MDEAKSTAPFRGLILAASIAFVLVVAVAVYVYGDGLIDSLTALARGKSGAAQPHIRY